MNTAPTPPTQAELTRLLAEIHASADRGPSGPVSVAKAQQQLDEAEARWTVAQAAFDASRENPRSLYALDAEEALDFAPIDTGLAEGAVHDARRARLATPVTGRDLRAARLAQRPRRGFFGFFVGGDGDESGG